MKAHKYWSLGALAWLILNNQYLFILVFSFLSFPAFQP